VYIANSVDDPRIRRLAEVPGKSPGDRYHGTDTVYIANSVDDPRIRRLAEVPGTN
jgi:hypothetical protein